MSKRKRGIDETRPLAWWVKRISHRCKVRQGTPPELAIMLGDMWRDAQLRMHRYVMKQLEERCR